MKEKNFNCELKTDGAEKTEPWRCKLVKMFGSDMKPSHFALWEKGKSAAKRHIPCENLTVIGVLENAIGVKFPYGNSTYFATINIK